MTWLFFILLISVVWCMSVVRSQYEPYGENTAFGKPADQSTTYIENGFMYNASLGVDGGISTLFSNKTCSHTGVGPTYAWWTVDLVGFYFIKFIRIYQWIQGTANRLDGSEMYVRLKNNTWQRIYFNSTWPSRVFNVSVELDKQIGEIMLNNSKWQGEAAFICVCELEAFEGLECSPYSIRNGSITVVKYGDSNQTFTYGTELNAICHEGYRILDDGVLTNETESTLECNATGNWSRNLTCSVTVCEWPQNLPNNSKQTLTPGIAGNTTYNATLTVECNEGYNYSLQEVEPLRCASDGFWAGNLGICNVIDCSRPLDIPGNSTVMSSTGLAGNTSYNSTFTVVCNKGFNYTLPENEPIRCADKGRWIGTVGLCNVIDCGWPLNIPGNSTILSSTGLAGNTSYNATFTVVCDKGFNYTLTGNETIRCADKGQWNGILGLCEVIECGLPPAPPSNSVPIVIPGIAGNTSYNTTMTVVCTQGYNYTYHGSETVRCDDDGIWEAILGNCNVIDCGWPLNIPGNSTILSSTGLAGNTSYNATFTVVCDKGFNYTLTGNETIRCADKGQWNGILGLCEVIECGLPPAPPSNSVPIVIPGIAGNTSYNTTMTVVCTQGYNYTYHGSETVRCDDDGIWEAMLGNCNVIDCGWPLNIPGNSTILSSTGLAGNTSYNATFTVVCDKGFNYTLTGNETIRCADKGQWNGILGLCEVIECGLPPAPPSNSVPIVIPGIAGNTSYNTTMTVVCIQGYNYTYHGSETVRCDDDGIWEAILGNCNAKNNSTIRDILQRAIECFIIFDINNGEIKVTTTGVDGRNNTYGVILSVECNSGFKSNVLEITCLESGLSAQPVCNPDPRPTDLTAAIVGSVVTPVILVTLVVGIFIFMRRRKKHKDDATRNFDEIDETNMGGSSNLAEMDHQKGRSNRSKKSQESYFTQHTSNGNAQAAETNGDDDCYENIQSIRTEDIKVEDLFDFVLQRRSKSNLYEAEYKQAARSVTKSKDVAMQAENKRKNRYKGMVPYDDNRVKLHIWDADMENDYINASFIDGFSRPQAYVAAQGPMENTLSDFWRMIWQLKTKKIVMLTNLTEGTGRKCTQYWPDEGTMDFEKINVQLIQTDQFSDFTIRTMKIKMNNDLGDKKSRMIKQFHFTTWPDKSVPRYSSSMVHFRHKIHSTEVEGTSNGPLVVHCSAGVGRTGTFIAIDFLVNQAEAKGNVNVAFCLESLRNQRVLMVQTLEQYIFIHEVLVQALTCTTSAISARDFQDEYRKLIIREPKQKKTFLQMAFEKLQILSPTTDENTYAVALDTGNRDKNRYCNILPDESYRPYLSSHVNGRNSYINAVFLPAYKDNDAFIITQTPLENTIVDFWRLVYQYDVSSIVMLNTLSQMKDSERYWPQKGSNFNCPPFEIHLESEETFGCSEVFKLILIYQEEQRYVRLSRANYWADDERVPKSPVHVLEHVELVQGWQTESAGRNPLVVHCMNGAERSGLFCVIAAVLERTKIEQDVAIEHIVRQLRHRRPQIIPDLEQFRFCHEAVLAYLNQYDTYANF